MGILSSETRSLTSGDDHLCALISLIALLFVNLDAPVSRSPLYAISSFSQFSAEREISYIEFPITMTILF